MRSRREAVFVAAVVAVGLLATSPQAMAAGTDSATKTFTGQDATKKVKIYQMSPFPDGQLVDVCAGINRSTKGGKATFVTTLYGGSADSPVDGQGMLSNGTINFKSVKLKKQQEGFWVGSKCFRGMATSSGLKYLITFTNIKSKTAGKNVQPFEILQFSLFVIPVNTASGAISIERAEYAGIDAPTFWALSEEEARQFGPYPDIQALMNGSQ